MGEAFITRRSGGGAGLNFRIIGGTTTPSNPKENDIWVNTENKVTGFLFTSEVPNLYDTELTSAKELSGQYIKENGEIASNSSFAVSGYVELPRVTKYITVYHGTAGSSTMYHAFYDADKNFISSVFRENKTLTYDVPSNAYYVRLSLCTMSTADKLTFLATVDDGSVEEGTVLISTGASSPVEFNALKKNGIVVYPISAKQYVGGAWVSKTAKSYHGGQWVSWVHHIVKDGVLLESMTVDRTGNTVTQNNGYVTFGAAKNSIGVFTTDEPIDLTSFNRLSIKITGGVSYQVSGKSPGLCIGTSRPTSTANSSASITNVVAFKGFTVTGGESVCAVSAGTYELDIADYKGKYYVGLIIGGSNYIEAPYVRATEFVLS